ncbi:CDGSH iron-sulfur domain-containing protein [Desulfovirgula thermocuniculi]|uniref:CDGSH iron-sulfur domain-containing protein n=1 Tax=Desulfovirgula thermocuniculi TaxID=348842 RepID=UPI0003F682D9|nr:CDGSH iron-sulfur domain-containing protein [Desulfovirgula thermocuniculi]
MKEYRNEPIVVYWYLERCAHVGYGEGGELLDRGGRFALCRCGASANQPFCDGSHRGKE